MRVQKPWAPQTTSLLSFSVSSPCSPLDPNEKDLGQSKRPESVGGESLLEGSKLPSWGRQKSCADPSLPINNSFKPPGKGQQILLPPAYMQRSGDTE